MDCHADYRDPERQAAGGFDPALALDSLQRARAARSRSSPALSTLDSTRHAVGSDATAPNRPGWSRNTASQRSPHPPAIGEHHRQIDRYPARVMPGPPLPHPAGAAPL